MPKQLAKAQLALRNKEFISEIHLKTCQNKIRDKMFVNLTNVWLNDQLQKGQLNTVEKWMELIDNWC